MRRCLPEGRVLTNEDEERIYRNALRILAEIGVTVENRALLDLLASAGAEVDFSEERVRFPVVFMEAFVDEAAEEYDEVEGLEVSCLFPYGERASYANGLEVTAGTYPQFNLTRDGEFRPHTVESVAALTRLADALENYDRLGVMGIPSDVPPNLGPLHMRRLAWTHAANKLSNCGEVRSPDLFPYTLEMGRIMADHKAAPLRRYAFAEIELASTLRLARAEAEIFELFWRQGLLAGVGFMHSAGGSAPATLAGVVSLDVANSLFVNVLYRYCYGLRKLWLQTNASVLDMRRGMFPFGRPERALVILANGQMARCLGAGLWASAVYADAKAPDMENGLQSAFNTVPAILAGSLGIECFGVLSGGEAGSAVQLVIDNEYAGALKRFARGFEVNDETLAFDVIREVASSGFFAGTDHTLAHYRTEHWRPELFTSEGLNAWLAGDRKALVDRAWERSEEILGAHHPRGVDDGAEKALLAVIESAEKNLL